MTQTSVSGPGWQLHHGDCLVGLKELSDRSVDVVISDPPYSVHVETGQAVSSRRTGQAVIKRDRIGVGAMTGGKRRDGRTRSMGVGDMGVGDMGVGDMGVLVRELVRVSKRWIVLFCAWEQLSDYAELLDAHGGRYVRCCGWEKPDGTPQLSGDRPATWGECICVGYATRVGSMRWNGGGKRGLYREGVCRGDERLKRWNAETASIESAHPTQKPLELMRQLIADFSDPGEVVLDPFAGSGTTIVAARELGRQAVGWEINPAFYEVARRRLTGESTLQLPHQPSLAF